MNQIEYVCVFVRATGPRLQAVERLLLSFPSLLGGAFVECDLSFHAATAFLAVRARFAPGAFTPAMRDRLAFWTARAGGRASSQASLSGADRGSLEAHLAACELRRLRVLPATLADAARGFFTEAGAAPDRKAVPPSRPVLAMDVGGPGWEGVTYEPGGHALFVAAPIAPPVGDAIEMSIRVPGASHPQSLSAVVAEVRGAAGAGPGRAAGYTLRLESPPVDVEAALLRFADAPSNAFRAAPRFAVSGPVKVIAEPAAAPPQAPAGRAGRAIIEYASDQELAADFIENLSQGGAFVRTTSPLPVGSPVALELKLPNGADLAAKAVVAFVNPQGMGVRFTLDPDAEAALAAAIAHISARPRRALVVDDDALVRRMLVDALQGRGFEVLTAADGAEGLRTLSEELLALDLLLTDVCMPGLDGEAFVRTIRKAGGEIDLAIVAVTGRLEPGLEPRLEAAGADAVLDKALGPELIAQAADAVLERKRLATAS